MKLSRNEPNACATHAARMPMPAHAGVADMGQFIRDIPIPAAVVHFADDQTWLILGTNVAFNSAFGGASSPVPGTPLDSHLLFPHHEAPVVPSSEPMHIQAVTRPTVGHPVPVILTFSGAIDANPALRFIFVQNSGQQNTEIAAARAREQLQALFNNGPDINYVLGPRGILVDINEAGAQQLGYTRDDLISGKHTARICEADRQLVNDKFRRVMRREVHRFEARFIRHDGSVMLASIVARPNLQNGKVVGLVGVAQDITQQRATQTRLQESEQRYRALFINHIDAVITIDREGNFLHANPAFERMIGVTVEDLQKTHYLPLVVPALRDFTSRQFDKAADGHTVEYETRISDAAHNEIDLYVTLIPVTVDNAVREIHCIAKDITAIRQARSELERMAFTHRLTGLPNRNALDEHLMRLVQHGTVFSVVNVDLERFKAVNDRYGRNIGDGLLKAVARRVDGFVSAPTLLFHYSGDNFVVVHPHACDEEAFEYASAVENLLRAPFAIDDLDLAISANIGVCVFPEDGYDPESLMRRSEDAMLEAKRRGRRRIAFYRELASDDDSRLLKLEFALRHALENDDFTIVYQPQVDVQTGEIHGVEALLRWTHPELGPISPVEFIPIAERNGLIHDIGMWVVEEACRQLRAWEVLGYPRFRLAVNVSIDQFYDSEFYERLERAVLESTISPQSLVIEVTESIAANADAVLTQLLKVKNLGVGIAIDDFGTGYSSLRYLRDFPVDYLKIDRSFVNRIEQHQEDRNLVATVIELARNFGLSTIAEGVETAGQMTILRELGAPLAQGYFISQPLPALQFEKWLGQTS